MKTVCVDLCLGLGCSLRAENEASGIYNQTPVHAAVLKGRTEVVRRLLDRDLIDANWANKAGYCLLMLPIMSRLRSLSVTT